MKTQQVQWVPLAERPPSDDSHYLVHAPSSDPRKPLITIAWYDPKEGRWSLIPSPWAHAITHWMELPKPPSAEPPGSKSPMSESVVRSDIDRLTRAGYQPVVVEGRPHTCHWVRKSTGVAATIDELAEILLPFEPSPIAWVSARTSAAARVALGFEPA